jgi:hypothetical protein
MFSTGSGDEEVQIVQILRLTWTMRAKSKVGKTYLVHPD